MLYSKFTQSRFLFVIFMLFIVNNVFAQKSSVTEYVLNENEKITKRFKAGLLTPDERNELKMLVVTLYEDYEANNWQGNPTIDADKLFYEDQLKDNTNNEDKWNAKDPAVVKKMEDLIKKYAKQGELSREERVALRKELRQIVNDFKSGKITKEQFKKRIQKLRKKIHKEGKDDEKREAKPFKERVKHMKEVLKECRQDGKIDSDTINYLKEYLDKAEESNDKGDRDLAKTQIQNVREHIQLFCHRSIPVDDDTAQ